MGFKNKRKEKSLMKDNLGNYLDYSREKRVDELLDARNECIDEIEILMKQMSRKLKRGDLRLKTRRGKRPNDMLS